MEPTTVRLDDFLCEFEEQLNANLENTQPEDWDESREEINFEILRSWVVDTINGMKREHVKARDGDED